MLAAEMAFVTSAELSPTASSCATNARGRTSGTSYTVTSPSRKRSMMPGTVGTSSPTTYSQRTPASASQLGVHTRPEGVRSIAPRTDVGRDRLVGLKEGRCQSPEEAVIGQRIDGLISVDLEEVEEAHPVGMVAERQHAIGQGAVLRPQERLPCGLPERRGPRTQFALDDVAFAVGVQRPLADDSGQDDECDNARARDVSAPSPGPHADRDEHRDADGQRDHHQRPADRLGVKRSQITAAGDHAADRRHGRDRQWDRRGADRGARPAAPARGRIRPPTRPCR